jgi:alpha-mannosidase
LIAVPAIGTDSFKSKLRVESSDGVTVIGLKPADDGKALIVRLFGASGKNGRANLIWNEPRPSRICLSDTSEKCGEPVTEAVKVPGYGVVTLRAEP